MNTVLPSIPSEQAAASNITQRARKGYDATSIMAYLWPKETYAAGAARLAQEWKDGRHPVQLKALRKAGLMEDEKFSRH